MPNLSRISNRSFLGRVLRLPLRLVPKRLDVPIVAGPLRGFRWRVGSSTHGCWLGSYEYEKVSALAGWLRPGMVAYDIGANAGYYTMLFARAAGATGRVYSFEPFAENVVNLLRHVRSNGLSNCTILQVALAATRSVVGFHPGLRNSTGAISEADCLLRVPTVTIDQLVAEVGLPLPDLIKMDVEGAEAGVLSGARETMARKKPVWFVSLHGDEQKRHCQSQLEAAGYRIFTLDGRHVTAPLESMSADEIYATG